MHHLETSDQCPGSGPQRASKSVGTLRHPAVLSTVTGVCWTQFPLNGLLTKFGHISSLATKPGSLMGAHRLCCQPLIRIPKLTPAFRECLPGKQEFPDGDGEGPNTPSAQRGLLSHPLVAQAVALPVSGDWWCGEAASHRCIRTGGPPAEPGRAGASRGAYEKSRGRMMAGVVGARVG